MKALTDQVNQTGGAGMPGVLQNFPLVNRVGLLLHEDDFLKDLSVLVDRHEAGLIKKESQAERLAKLSYPKLTGSGSKNWRTQLHGWMQTVLDAFLGFNVEIPEPPALNRTQRRAFSKYGLMPLYIPAITEAQYPAHMIKPAWGKYLTEVHQIQRITLPGQWVAYEVIEKPNYQDGVYPSDKLMEDIGIATRFAHPYSGKDEGDDIIKDILPKIAGKLAFKANRQIQLPTAEVWNFVGNLFNWFTLHTANSFPDLGSTLSWEWVVNCYGSRRCLLVGHHYCGGLAVVRRHWRDGRFGDVGFRILVVL